METEIIEWESNSVLERFTYQEALEYCSDRKHFWRLPSVHEMIMSVQNREPGFISAMHWSCEEYSPTHAYAVFFPTGNIYRVEKTAGLAIRCVSNF